MSIIKDTPTNGATKDVKPAAAPKQEQPKAPEQKPELSNFGVPAPAKTPSIEDRMNKFHALGKLLERREKISDAVDSLSDFYISPSGDSCNVRLTDSKGKTFAISHPIVIGEIVAMAKAKLLAELATIDNDFNFNF
ncbi:hypothetical protein [Limnovirga soli]|uniref:Uncharacterized protein n=1 Tax=Limnovirga soli TaxID=2656915 RepID=A0A8J8FHM9_9BACT|nr:hypothetical protein [Limnovirga soli]NNV57353.1 hypothetical protein [Limnovirga soli]